MDRPAATDEAGSTLEAALAYTARGWPVIPLHTPTANGGCSCRRIGCDKIGKHPRTSHGWKDGTTDPNQVRAWWGRWPEANIGIVTGRDSGLVVLDVDPRNGGDDSLDALLVRHGDLPETLEVVTGGGGSHYYLAHPGVHVGTKEVDDGLETRAAGAYVVAPPSQHASGVRYRWAADPEIPLASMPEWLLALSSHRASTPANESVRPAGEEIRQGTRNTTLARLAGTMRRRGMGEEAILAALRVENIEKCRPPLPEDEVARIARSVASYPPAADTGGQGAGSTVRSLAQVLENPAALQPPPIVIPGIAFAGRITLLAAREKAGKSTLASAGAAAVSSGAQFLGGSTHAGNVLWAGLEEHPNDLAARLIQFGANPERVFLVGRLWKPLEDLEAAVAQVKPVLVVIDTLAAFTEGVVSDPHSSVAWTPVMSRLTRLARDSNAAIVLLHHARKSDGSYRDSTAIGAGVDMLIEMLEGEGAERRMRVKARWPVGDYTLVLDASGYRVTTGEVSKDEQVLAYIRTHPGCKKRDLREGVSGRAEQTDAALDRLIQSGHVENRGSDVLHAYHVTVPDAGRLPGTLRDTPANQRVPAGNPQGHATDTASGHGDGVPVSGFQTPRGESWDTGSADLDAPAWEEGEL